MSSISKIHLPVTLIVQIVKLGQFSEILQMAIAYAMAWSHDKHGYGVCTAGFLQDLSLTWKQATASCSGRELA